MQPCTLRCYGPVRPGQQQHQRITFWLLTSTAWQNRTLTTPLAFLPAHANVAMKAMVFIVVNITAIVFVTVILIITVMLTSMLSKDRASRGRPPSTPAMTSRSLSSLRAVVWTRAGAIGRTLVISWHAYCSRPGCSAVLPLQHRWMYFTAHVDCNGLQLGWSMLQHMSQHEPCREDKRCQRRLCAHGSIATEQFTCYFHGMYNSSLHWVFRVGLIIV